MRSSSVWTYLFRSGISTWEENHRNQTRHISIAFRTFLNHVVSFSSFFCYHQKSLVGYNLNMVLITLVIRMFPVFDTHLTCSYQFKNLSKIVSFHNTVFNLVGPLKKSRQRVTSGWHLNLDWIDFSSAFDHASTAELPPPPPPYILVLVSLDSQIGASFIRNSSFALHCSFSHS